MKLSSPARAAALTAMLVVPWAAGQAFFAARHAAAAARHYAGSMSPAWPAGFDAWGPQVGLGTACVLALMIGTLAIRASGHRFVWLLPAATVLVAATRNDGILTGPGWQDWLAPSQARLLGGSAADLLLVLAPTIVYAVTARRLRLPLQAARVGSAVVAARVAGPCAAVGYLVYVTGTEDGGSTALFIVNAAVFVVVAGLLAGGRLPVLTSLAVLAAFAFTVPSDGRGVLLDVLSGVAPTGSVVAVVAGAAALAAAGYAATLGLPRLAAGWRRVFRGSQVSGAQPA